MVEFSDTQHERMASVLKAIQEDAAAIEAALKRNPVSKAASAHLKAQRREYTGMIRLLRCLTDLDVEPEQLIDEVKAGNPVNIQGFQLPEPYIDPELLKTARGRTD